MDDKLFKLKELSLSSREPVLTFLEVLPVLEFSPCTINFKNFSSERSIQVDQDKREVFPDSVVSFCFEITRLACMQSTHIHDSQKNLALLTLSTSFREFNHLTVILSS